jgi:hypothetical protein
MRFSNAIAVGMMTAALATATPAYADETNLYRQAAENSWTYEDWQAFERWANWHNFIQLNDRANSGDTDAVKALIGLFFPDAYPQFLRIIQRESNYRPWAKNPRSTASGLTQQLNIHAWRYERRGWNWQTDRFDAAKNLTIARELYDESGLRPWRATA